MKYQVTVREVYIQPYSIEAESEQDAIDRVADGKGDLIEDRFEYSHVLDRSLWTIEPIA